MAPPCVAHARAWVKTILTVMEILFVPRFCVHTKLDPRIGDAGSCSTFLALHQFDQSIFNNKACFCFLFLLLDSFLLYCDIHSLKWLTNCLFFCQVTALLGEFTKASESRISETMTCLDSVMGGLKTPMYDTSRNFFHGGQLLTKTCRNIAV